MREVDERLTAALRILVSAMLLFTLAGGAVVAMDFSTLARYYPLTVSVLGALLTIPLLIRALVQGPWRSKATRSNTQAGSQVEVAPSVATLKSFRYLAWTIGLIAGIALLGPYVAIVAFLSTFLWFESGMALRWVLFANIGYVVLLQVLVRFVNLRLPETIHGLW